MSAPTITAEPGVAELYDSDFVRHFDTRAKLWEHLVCREANAAFHHRLQLLCDRPLRVLDLGCGTGRNLQRFSGAALQIDTYLGVDSSARMISAARAGHPYSRADFRHCDADTALAADERYDLITATWLLSHHRDPADLIRKATERLHDGGRFMALAITDSNRPSARLHGWRFRYFLHSHPVSPASLRNHAMSFEHVSASGLISLIEYQPQTLIPRGANRDTMRT
ncbi:MAG: class I SAM-dependent methyltransferase [Ornithinimicrobium sp.]